MTLVIIKYFFVVSVISGDPEFTEPITNVTVPAGRSVKLGCSVRNLGSYKVWYIFFPSEIEYVLNITDRCTYIYIYIFIWFFLARRNQNPLFWLNPARKKHSLHTLSHYLDLANQLWVLYIPMLFFGWKVILFQSNLPRAKIRISSQERNTSSDHFSPLYNIKYYLFFYIIIYGRYLLTKRNYLK